MKAKGSLNPARYRLLCLILAGIVSLWLLVSICLAPSAILWLCVNLPNYPTDTTWLVEQDRSARQLDPALHLFWGSSFAIGLITFYQMFNRKPC